jgi:hypothetical protein
MPPAQETLMRITLSSIMLVFVCAASGCGGRPQQADIYSLGIENMNILHPDLVQVSPSAGAKTLHIIRAGKHRIKIKDAYGALRIAPLAESDLLILASLNDVIAPGQIQMDFKASVIDRRDGAVLGLYRLQKAISTHRGYMNPEYQAEKFLDTVVALHQPSHIQVLYEPLPPNYGHDIAISDSMNAMKLLYARRAPEDAAPEQAAAFLAAMQLVRKVIPAKHLGVAAEIDRDAAIAALAALEPFVKNLSTLSRSEKAMTGIALWNTAVLKAVLGADPTEIRSLSSLAKNTDGSAIQIPVGEQYIDMPISPDRHINRTAEICDRLVGYKQGKHAFKVPELPLTVTLEQLPCPAFTVALTNQQNDDLPAVQVSTSTVVSDLRSLLTYSASESPAAEVRPSIHHGHTPFEFTISITNRTQRLLALDPSALRGSHPISIRQIQLGSQLLTLGGADAIQIAPADTARITVTGPTLENLAHAAIKTFELQVFDLPKTVDSAGAVTARENYTATFTVTDVSSKVSAVQARLR